jgi:hypothetical protein
MSLQKKDNMNVSKTTVEYATQLPKLLSGELRVPARVKEAVA